MSCYTLVIDCNRVIDCATVTINDEGSTRQVSTNAYFSSGMFAKFTLEDYNNKKVIGLYDSQMDKFYIIKKVS